MKRIRRGRPTRREEVERINASHRYYAMSAGKPELGEKFCRALPKHRAPRKPSGRPLERNVLKEVYRALRADPRVTRVERNTSGVFQDGDRFISVGTKGKLDFTVFMKTGFSPAWGEIECKRDHKTKPEPHQYTRIALIKSEGGFSGWAWDSESALALLPCA